MSDKSRIYFGKKFTKDKKGYWIHRGKFPHAHRWVWININGEIHKGMDVHHIDGDKSNNDISNLELHSRSDHLKLHWKDPIFRDNLINNLHKIRPLTLEYIKSEEGRKKASIQAKQSWKYRKEIDCICLNCNKTFCTKQNKSDFCGENCYMNFRRKRGDFNITVSCAFCGNDFIKTKYSPIKCCSISCGTKEGIRNRNKA